MMERVGIVRAEVNLKKQKSWLEQFKFNEKINLDAYCTDDITKIFMLINAELITNSALERTESRGGHFRSDYPTEDDLHWLKETIIHKNNRGLGKSHEHIETALAT
jgi:L-aspartate oxidase